LIPEIEFVYSPSNNKKIKVMLKQLIQAVKENPLETVLDMIAMIAIFAFGYVLLILGAVITGNI